MFHIKNNDLGVQDNAQTFVKAAPWRSHASIQAESHDWVGSKHLLKLLKSLFGPKSGPNCSALDAGGYMMTSQNDMAATNFLFHQFPKRLCWTDNGWQRTPAEVFEHIVVLVEPAWEDTCSLMLWFPAGVSRKETSSLSPVGTRMIKTLRFYSFCVIYT